MLTVPDTGVMTGDLDRAVGEWSGDAVVGAYLWWWSHGQAGAEPEDRWHGSLVNQTVELRGPAEVVEADCDLLARVLRGPEPNPYCDVAFCNIEHWPRVNKNAARMAFVSKGPHALELPHGRQLWDTRVLFDGGDWNMVPAAMLDLLSGGAKVTVTGATFYAAGADYRDEAGSNPWEAMIAHNPMVNWRIVKNLYDARVVAATGLAATVLSYDDDEYRSAITAHRGL
jgi:hypothetical protein